jgi:hypothetical protein
MIIDLVQKVFCTRNCVHLAHWRTKSYAQHKALGAFYDDIIDGIDKLVEAHMGASGKVIDEFDLPATKPVKDILKHLSDEANWINEHREHIANEIPALENIVDEITAIYLKTIYKLKQLS